MGSSKIKKADRTALIIRIKKYRVQGSCFRSNISETVKDIRVPFSLLARCKSHAKKRCNPCLCSCYRFWDIVVANINNFPILLEQLHICRRTSSHGIIIKIRIKKYRVQGSRFRSNISETVRVIRVSFNLVQRQESRYQTVQPTSLLLLSFLRYCSRQHQEFQDFGFWRQICSSNLVYAVERVRTA